MTPMVLSSSVARRGATPLVPRAGPAVGFSTLSMVVPPSSRRGRRADRLGDRIRRDTVRYDVRHPGPRVATTHHHVDVRPALERAGRLDEAIVLVGLEEVHEARLVARQD